MGVEDNELSLRERILLAMDDDTDNIQKDLLVEVPSPATYKKTTMNVELHTFSGGEHKIQKFTPPVEPHSSNC